MSGPGPIGNFLQMPTPEEIEAITKRYCQIRQEQDGKLHDWQHQLEVAQCMYAWFQAFKEVVWK